MAYPQRNVRFHPVCAKPRIIRVNGYSPKLPCRAGFASNALGFNLLHGWYQARQQVFDARFQG